MSTSRKSTQKSGNAAKRSTAKAATGSKTAPKKGGAKAEAPEISAVAR